MAIIGYGEQRSLLETGDFRKKVYQAIIKAAVAIRNEDPNTDHHQSRVSLANAVVINPGQNEQRFSEVLATQMTSTNPSDSDIDGLVQSGTPSRWRCSRNCRLHHRRNRAAARKYRSVSMIFLFNRRY